MDSTKINEQGITPLKSDFEKIEAIKTKEDLVRTICEFQVYAGSPLFSPAIYQDEKNSEKFALHFFQGGIGLPDRDYYFNKDLRNSEYQEGI
jgi:putative endopeptidase